MDENNPHILASRNLEKTKQPKDKNTLASLGRTADAKEPRKVTPSQTRETTLPWPNNTCKKPRTAFHRIQIATLQCAGLLRGGMMIKVKTLTGKEFEIDIEPTDTIERVKERVEEKEGIPPVQQRLIFGGKQMNDDAKQAWEYNILGGSVLHLVLALRDG
eukprot:symbB.v1.2.008120.t1/scaffold500.1/size195150/10